MDMDDFMRGLVIVMCVLSVFLLVYAVITMAIGLFNPGEPEYCKTTFQNGVTKYCDIGICHNGGCKFKCDDGTEIDSSFYTVECDANE